MSNNPRLRAVETYLRSQGREKSLKQELHFNFWPCFRPLLEDLGSVETCFGPPDSNKSRVGLIAKCERKRP